MRGISVAAESSTIIVLPLACALSSVSTASCINLTFCSGTAVRRCFKSGKMHSYRLLWGTKCTCLKELSTLGMPIIWLWYVEIMCCMLHFPIIILLWHYKLYPPCNQCELYLIVTNKLCSFHFKDIIIFFSTASTLPSCKSRSLNLHSNTRSTKSILL